MINAGKPADITDQNISAGVMLLCADECGNRFQDVEFMQKAQI